MNEAELVGCRLSVSGAESKPDRKQRAANQLAEVGDSMTFLTQKTLFFTSTSRISFINFKTFCSSDKNVHKCLRCLSSGGRFLIFVVAAEKRRNPLVPLGYHTPRISFRAFSDQGLFAQFTLALCLHAPQWFPLLSRVSYHTLSRRLALQDGRKKKCKVKSICK